MAEIRNLTTFRRLMDYNNGFSISSFFLLFLFMFSLDRCSIPSREVSILWSYLDISLLFSSYVYLIFKSSSSNTTNYIFLKSHFSQELLFLSYTINLMTGRYENLSCNWKPLASLMMMNFILPVFSSPSSRNVVRGRGLGNDFPDHASLRR